MGPAVWQARVNGLLHHLCAQSQALQGNKSGPQDNVSSQRVQVSFSVTTSVRLQTIGKVKLSFGGMFTKQLQALKENTGVPCPFIAWVYVRVVLGSATQPAPWEKKRQVLLFKALAQHSTDRFAPRRTVSRNDVQAEDREQDLPTATPPSATVTGGCANHTARARLHPWGRRASLPLPLPKEVV